MNHVCFPLSIRGSTAGSRVAKKGKTKKGERGVKTKKKGKKKKKEG